MKPIASASTITDQRIWRREAPIVRRRRELLRPLRHRDREGVEDHESADEERDEREREQEVADEARELADVVLGLLGLDGGGAHLRVLGEDRRRSRSISCAGRRALRAGDRDRVDLPFAVEQPLPRRQVEDRERRGAERVDVAELRDAGRP